MHPIFPLLALAALHLSASAAPPSLDSSFKKVTYFYVDPSEDTFNAIQDGLKAHLDELNKKEGVPLIVAVFLARVHSKHQWPISDIGKLDDQAMAIVANDPKSKLAAYVNDDQQVTPNKLDLWWMSFFATGDTAYLDRIRGQMGKIDGKDLGKILVRGAANWSYKANCRQHPAVLKYTKKLLLQDPPPPNADLLREAVEAAEKAKKDG